MRELPPVAATPSVPAVAAIAALAAPLAVPPPQPAEPTTLVAAVVPAATVHLTFRDGTALRLAPDDPRARAFRTLAGELVRDH